MVALDEIRAFLNVPEDDHDDDDLLDTLEDKAVALIQSRTGFTYGADGSVTVYARGYGTNELFLPRNATGDPTEVVQRAYLGATETVITAAQSDGWERRDSRLVRKSGIWRSGWEYKVTYPSGYAAGSEPELVRLAVMRIVAAWYQQRGVEGMSSVHHGPNYAVTKDSDAIKAILSDLPHRMIYA